MDEDLTASIAPDVLEVLRSIHFFERLDDLFAPLAANQTPAVCDRTFQLTENILRSKGLPAEDIADVAAVLRQRCACCDCEVLYNIAGEDSRFSRAYWQAKSEERVSPL